MDEQLFVGEVFDALAAKLGYDERELSTALGMPQGAVRALGSRQVTPAQARRFCEALGVELGGSACNREAVQRSP